MPKKPSVIVTGATGSMGRAAVRALASKGESIIAVCRSRSRGDELMDSILEEFPDVDLSLAVADLSSIESAHALADEMEGLEIKGLFNNAGTLLRDYTLSEDGLEMCVAVNYVAPFILCNRIGAMMKAGGNIVNMVSLTTRFPVLDRNFFKEKKEDYSQLGTYARSKLALLEFSIEYARRHPELHVNVSDPGIVNSNMISMGRWFDPLADIFFRPFCKSPEKGVSPALRALEADCTGRLFIGSRTKEIPPKYGTCKEIGWLWDETSRIAGHEPAEC